MFELKAIELIARHLNNAVDDGSDETARAGMAEAQYIAGMGFSNVGLGLVHGMAHPLGAFYDIPHGVANALLLPYVMQYNMESSLVKFGDVARAMGVDTAGMDTRQAAQAAVDAVRTLAVRVGIPQRLSSLCRGWPQRRWPTSARPEIRAIRVPKRFWRFTGRLFDRQPFDDRCMKKRLSNKF